MRVIQARFMIIEKRGGAMQTLIRDGKTYLPLDALDAMRLPRNPKRHASDRLARTIDRVGFIDTPTINAVTEHILGGHGRVDDLLSRQRNGSAPPAGVLVEDGRWYAPVHLVEVAPENEEFAAVALNGLTEAGGYDEATLLAVLDDIKAQHGDQALDDAGFDAARAVSISWDADDPLARCKGETMAQHNGLLDYAYSGLSLARLAAAYNGDNPTGDPQTAQVIRWWRARGDKPPTKQLGRLEKWSSRNDWQARVNAYHDSLADERSADHLRRVRQTEQHAQAVGWRMLYALEDALTSAENAARTHAAQIESALNTDSDGMSRVHVTAGADVEAMDSIIAVYSKAMDEVRRALRLPARYNASDVTARASVVRQDAGDIDLAALPADLVRQLSEHIDADDED